MDAISEYVQHDVPWDMLYADDLIIAADSSAKLQERFGEWQKALERKGLKANADKTETMVWQGQQSHSRLRIKMGKLWNKWKISSTWVQ